MKPQREFVAERRAAVHCPELLARAAQPAERADPMGAFAQVAERLARLLPAALEPFIGSPAQVEAAQPREIKAGTLASEIPALAANSLLAIGGSGGKLLVSLDAGAVLRIVDRAYGGRGEAPEPLPEAFPPSASLMVGRIETALAACLSGAFGLGPDDGLAVLRSDAKISLLEPFAARTMLALTTLTVSEPNGPVWQATIAMPLADLALLPDPLNSGTASAPRRAAPANPGDEPFGALPLTITAVLVDVQMPLATIARLEPGALLPVPVARDVPLRIGEHTVAHGTIGALDDRSAIQLTRTF